MNASRQSGPRLNSAWAFSVAPMMDWTDRHCRYFHRLLAPGVRLYTEMVTTGALIHGDRERFLRFDPSEHPVAIQLGGSEPADLARCARFAEQAGFDEVNLNVGCPSDRVQSGRFGACLMREPEVVRDGLSAMQDAVDIPVTIKTRLGVDELENYDYFRDFVATVAESGCRVFLVHARKAWLKGLSPKENREIPPLRYEWVHRLKREMPELTVAVNGGVIDLETVTDQLQSVDGVMIGRAAYQNPWLLTRIERRLNNPDWQPAPQAIIDQMMDYAERQMEQGVPLKSITRHMLGLFQGQPGAKRWRRTLSEKAHLPDADPGLLRQAMPAQQAA